ncbi:hypothetical protein LTS10_001763 [Elasticomyces elasticus]|nr:hypothetical protein LTS10_001763 [Elasticomyces elasticus]
MQSHIVAFINGSTTWATTVVVQCPERIEQSTESLIPTRITCSRTKAVASASKASSSASNAFTNKRRVGQKTINMAFAACRQEMNHTRAPVVEDLYISPRSRVHIRLFDKTLEVTPSRTVHACFNSNKLVAGDIEPWRARATQGLYVIGFSVKRSMPGAVGTKGKGTGRAANRR